MGYRILLDPALAPALSAAGLASAPAVLALGGPREARHVRTVLDLPIEGTVGRFHLKRYHYPGWAESKGLLGRGTLWGTPPEIAEFRMLASLREQGVPAARPVVAAAETRGGRLVGHALITEHVPDTVDLAQRLAAPGDPVRDDPKVRREVLGLLARAVHRMHAAGFVHGDCFARNVLVRAGEQPRVWFVDCRRGGPPSLRRGVWHDLAAIDSDLKGRVPRTDRLRMARAYFGGDVSLDGVVAKVAKYRPKVR